MAAATARRLSAFGQGPTRPHARDGLYAPEAWVARLSSCWHGLAGKRAVLLAQLAPNQVRDDARLEYSLRALPPWLRAARGQLQFRRAGRGELDELMVEERGADLQQRAQRLCRVANFAATRSE